MAYEQQHELIADVTDQMQICADMVGERDESKKQTYGFVPGLGETELAKILRTRIESIRNGIFQVMFTGCFSSGKSTLINALIRRDVLKTGAIPETAVITKVFFNADEPNEKVVIYKRDQVEDSGRPVTEEMYDLKEFFNVYRVDDKDRGKFLRTVNHVEIFLHSDGIAGSMIQLVDSPGTQASAADDEISKRFVKQADAVIFLISAIAAMDQYDRDYIAQRFANRQMKNVFFVVNLYNLLNTDEDRRAVRNRVREELKPVFLDEHGDFDEELYDERVFFVNAFGSLNTRLGKETDLGGISIMIPDDKTGVPQFEKVLGEFLTSGDKDKVALSAYRPQMASIFVAAEKSAQERRDALNRGIIENKNLLLAYENDKVQIEQEILGIKKAIEDTEKAILRDAKDAYDNFLKAIDENWDDFFDNDKKNSMQIGYWSLIGAHTKKALTFWKDHDVRALKCDEATQEATQAFADGIREFIEERSEAMSNEVAFKIRNNIAQLMTDLNNRQRDLEKLNMPIDLEEIIEKIALEKNVPIVGSPNEPKLGQAFVALFMADPELITLAGSGNAGTLDFIVQVIKVNIIDVILATLLVAVIGNIFGLILFAAYKIMKYFFTSEDLTAKLIADTKTTILDGYRDKENRFVCDKDGKPIFTGLRGDAKATYINKVSAVIHGIMRRTSNEIVNGINGTLAEIEDTLKKTNELLENDERALSRELARLNNILRVLAEAISKISELTNGTTLDRQQIRNLAVTSQ